MTTPTISPSNGNLKDRLWDVLSRTFDLGFTAFGGPPVHFQMLHQRFVDGNGKTPWVDEQTYQEIFSICQALPGPASTKMVFCIALWHAGIIPALFVFLLWSLPGAIGMYGLALGIEKVDQDLPAPVYALLSGLNASTVGVIALAAVQLARKAITDRLTRLLVLLGACAGLCYNALWYFPTIIIIGGVITVAWDHWLRAQVGRVASRVRHSSEANSPARLEESEAIPIDNLRPEASGTSRRLVHPTTEISHSQNEQPTNLTVVDHGAHKIPLKIGLLVIASVFAIFTTLMVVRGTVKSSPLELQLFTNMFLAGTIIFGGGPVVIPLLREYVVEPGWVTPRDFLIGLAIIQAFPGPNFNFAVYLGGLALGSRSSSAAQTTLGAVLGFVGIFFPGMTLAIGFQAIWRALRVNRFVISLLRGINACAVGLVFTAVHRLWEIGYLKADATQGVSLGSEPWWVVVTAVTYVAVESFGVPTAAAILGGGVLGLTWFGAVGR